MNAVVNIIKKLDDIAEESVLQELFPYGYTPFDDYQDGAISIESYSNRKMMLNLFEYARELADKLINSNALPFNLVDVKPNDLQALQERLGQIEPGVLDNSSNKNLLKKMKHIKDEIAKHNRGFAVNDLELLGLLSKLAGLSDVYINQRYDYDEFISLFFKEIECRGLTHIFPVNVNCLVKEEAVAINDFVGNIRASIQGKDYRKSISDSKKMYKDIFVGYSNYIDTLFNNHSRLMVVRVDLAYTLKHTSEHTGRTVDKRQVDVEKASKDRKKFLNSIRQTKISPALKGYIWKLEYGEDKGYHFHMIFFFDGSKVKKDAYYADRIGSYWKKITNSQGCYFNCNQAKSQYKHLGIGMALLHNSSLS